VKAEGSQARLSGAKNGELHISLFAKIISLFATICDFFCCFLLPQFLDCRSSIIGRQGTVRSQSEWGNAVATSALFES
jgi:hypothetical protein